MSTERQQLPVATAAQGVCVCVSVFWALVVKQVPYETKLLSTSNTCVMH